MDRAKDLIESLLRDCSQIIEINSENITKISKYLSDRLLDSGEIKEDDDVFNAVLSPGGSCEKIRITGRHEGNPGMLYYEHVDKDGMGIISVNAIAKEQKHRLANLLSKN